MIVIHDNEDIADMLAALVETLGGAAWTAHDGPGGIRAVLEFAPDVVLLDLGLPGMDGYETCRRIRREPAGPDAFIVAVTGWGQEEDKRRARIAGRAARARWARTAYPPWRRRRTTPRTWTPQRVANPAGDTTSVAQQPQRQYPCGFASLRGDFRFAIPTSCR